MQSSEGRLGRVFYLRLEDGDAADAIRGFAVEKGIHAAQVFIVGSRASGAVLLPSAEGAPDLHCPPDADFRGCDVVVQEILGFTFHRVTDPSSGRETLTRVRTKTRVMERPAPTPAELGPGTIPVYLFNAEFN